MGHTSWPRMFLLFLFYSSLMFTVPQYIECEDVYPDEILDLLGMPVQAVAVLKHDLSGTLYHHLTAHFSERRRTENLRVLLYTGKLFFSVTLLC